MTDKENNESTPAASSALKALTKHIDALLAEEGITPELLECVDLDVAFSPVICFRGERLEDAVKVDESMDPNRYLLRHPMIPNGFVTKDALKIMRCRYLLENGKRKSAMLNRFFQK